MSKIKVKLTDKNCLPTKKYRWDAGWDLKALSEVKIRPSEVVKVHTGVYIEVPARFFGMVVPRSGLGTKHGVTLANDIGIIDSEYRGEILVYLVNQGKESVTIKQYDRFAQLVIVPVNNADLWVVDSLSKTNRGVGGFGSTGDKDALEKHVEETNAADEVTFNDKLMKVSEAIKENNVDAERQKRLEELRKLTPAEYTKLQKKGKLFEEYPIATGNMNEDLGI